MTAKQTSNKNNNAPAFKPQFAIRHKPSGRLRGRPFSYLDSMADWNPAAGPDGSATATAAPKTYGTLTAARNALNNYRHDRADLEIVELALAEAATHSAFPKGGKK